MSSPVTLKGHMHVCPMINPGPKPHIGGPVVSTQQTFLTVEGVPVATAEDEQMPAHRLCGAPHNRCYVSGEIMWRTRSCAGRGPSNLEFSAT